MKITIYTKSSCPNCMTAKQLLKSKNIQYEEFWVDANEEAAKKVVALNIRQMPAIWIDEQFVGGLAGLQAALKLLNL